MLRTIRPMCTTAQSESAVASSTIGGGEDTGIVTAKIDEQKTEATRNRILELVAKLSA